MKKVLCFLLAVLMLAPAFVSCGKTEAPGDPAGRETSGQAEDDRFSGTDFRGRSLCFQNSNAAATSSMSTSNDYIEGLEELSGDAALDSAIKRNQTVESLLNVKLEFSPVQYTYEEVPAAMRQLVLSGDTTYQVVINDLWGCVPITAEGIFRNVYSGGAVFDFAEKWWYDDFMDDISIDTNKRYALAGDFFLDHLRNTHCLIMNKNIYRDLYGDPDSVYSSVLDRTWTIDSYNRIAGGAYLDLNGNGELDGSDQYGSVGYTKWSCCIPWLIAGDPGFIERDENGHPAIAIDNEKAYQLVDLLRVTYDEHSTCITNGETELDEIGMFTSGQSLFLWGQRLGSLEMTSLRQSDADLAILPYPMRDATQKDYVTAVHDTTEIGFLPSTLSDADMPFVSTVLEVLCRETNRSVLPIYYESSLKIKYTRDSMSGQMIDIIHDHYGNSFPLAWSVTLDDILLYSTLYACIAEDSPKLSSKIKSRMKSARNKLNDLIEQYDALDD